MMGVPVEHWKELKEMLIPYTEKCMNKEITYPEYLEISDEIYKEFLEKHSE